MSLWLNDDELYETTGYRQRERQRRALAQMLIPFKVRPMDGFPLVERWRFEGNPTQRRNKEPNYG